MTTSYFLAGVMQGTRKGADLADQGYRAQLRDLILSIQPDAQINDPGELMQSWLATDADLIRKEHAALADSTVVRRTEWGTGIVALTDVFHRLTELAADSDVCVAWLPGQEASMGTAAEMLSAYRAGKSVVAITPMRQNLAVLACSSLIVPDIETFEAWLAAGPRLEHR